MFILKSFLLFFVCLLTACDDSISEIEHISQIPPANLLLKMNRTGCWKFCPVYELSIQPNGKVLFDGIQDTATKGKVEDILSQEKIAELVAEIEKADFFSLENSYTYVSDNCPSWMTDAPTAILYINLNGKEKKITHSLGCKEEYGENTTQKIFPQQLYNLENKIDEIVETKRWIGEKAY